MIAKIMLKLSISLWALFGIFSFAVYAQDVDFAIIPEADNAGIIDEVEKVAQKPGEVMDTYKEIANKQWRTLWDKMASWIMNWDTILDYVVYLVKFLSQLGLLVGACMFIYAGYLYASSVFSGGDAGNANKAVKNAIIWIVVLSFSFAILKILTSMFIE